MLAARATLYAGNKHARYADGTAVRAIVFAKVESPDELKAKSLRSLQRRGWVKMTISGYATLAEDHAFPNEHSEEARAFLAARMSGIGIVVLGLVQ